MNKTVTLFLIIILSIFFFQSCASYKVDYSKEGEDWASTAMPSEESIHTMYLVGDAGNAPLNGTTNVLKYLKKILPSESDSSSIVFLGDNLYPDGMPPRGLVADRVLAEYRLQIQLNILEEFKGRPVFIPGNHDWRRWGLKGLKRQEKIVEQYLNRSIKDDDDWENYFMPDNGCPGPDIIELNEQLVLVIIDSQWWLTDWDKEPTIHDGCEVKNRFMFQFTLEEIMRKNRRKNVVVAMHHPLYTYGPHGGATTLKEHIFPLTQLDDNLYVPFPVIGTMAAFLRGAIGSKQDVANKLYKDLKRAILTGAKKNGNFIFVAGHEHALQYIENDQQTFIVSGAGSKQAPVRIGQGSEFAYGKRGYSTIDFYEDGTSWVQFWIPNEEGTEAKVIFRKKMREKDMPSEETIPTSFPLFEQGLDSIETVVSQIESGKIGFVQKTIMGVHYRNVYQNEYKFPVLDLSTYKGGMIPVKRGGGNQTNSLRLEDSTGRQYVLRAMTKDASRTLPFPFNKMTAAKFVTEDNFLSTHPFAPTAIPALADAANVYHTNPKLYYVPKQPAMGIFNDEYGNDVYLLEERPDGDWKGTGEFGDSKKIMSTPDVADKGIKNHKHYIDNDWAVRSRLFDLIIGDWDRHDDQWRWARFDKEDENGKDKHRLYRPIPRDRDQAFSKYDGPFVAFVRLFMPFLRQLRVYGPEIDKIKWSTWSSRNFDRSFMNEADWEDWEEQVKYIQEHVTDEVIENAFKVWPQDVQDLTADHIIKSMKARRDNLEDIARRYYTRLSKAADVYGTEKRELFEVDRLADGKVKVTVSELSKKAVKGHTFFQRTYTPDITKEIILYGIGEDDQFKIMGEADNSILVRIVGGQGEDEFLDESKVKNGPPKTLIYDDLTENQVHLGTEAKDKRSSNREINIYDRRAAHYETNFFIPLPILGINPDDGFVAGMSALWTTYAFKKVPFSSLHSFQATYAFQTNAWGIDYEGDFLNVFNEWDFYLKGNVHGSSYASNFFGLGNDTRNVEPIDFYRTRQSNIHLFPAFKKRIASGSGNFKIGPVFEMRDLEPTEGRFLITDFRESLDDEIYRRKVFLGAKIGFEFLNLDNYVFPEKGIHFITELGYLDGISNDNSKFGTLRSSLAFYQSIDKQGNFVLASKIGFEKNIGENYEFYHAPHLGGRGSLRGYRFERFYGDSAFWQNIDLRARLFSSYNKTLPFTIGLYAGFDYGRVWVDGQNSDNWHYDYGGGFWFAPVDVLSLTFGVFQPKEDFEEGPRFTFRLGIGF